jgi:hypothetical protein
VQHVLSGSQPYHEKRAGKTADQVSGDAGEKGENIDVHEKMEVF